MSAVTMTRGKFEGISACAGHDGVIAAAAMDQRGSLQKAIAKARGDDGTALPDDLATFKAAVTEVLTPHATAILMDPEYGLVALEKKAPGTGVLLAYEKTGYDATVKGRLPDLLDEWSALRLKERGANAVKILLYYDPDDDEAINTIKHAFIERVGAECVAHDIAFFLEPVTYADGVSGADWARRKPDAVTKGMAEFSKSRYAVDVLKVEVPIDMKYVSGTQAFGGEEVYTRDEALRLFVEASKASSKPFIYLSAGVSNEIFQETLELAAESGADYSGVLCGRATWQEGVPIFGRDGAAALVSWLKEEGVKNINAVNAAVAKGAKPWWTVYGGVENISVVDPAIG
ncbi:MAG: tagatose 1,6-diphosphate aldolase [Thermomicrobiales bacterium]